MADSKAQATATDLSILAVRLVRWLRAADERPTLSGPEASAMAVVVHSGGIAPSMLADLEQVRRPTITRIVDRLVAQGFVCRLANPTDQRASIIVATRKGQELWLAGQLRRVAPLAERIENLKPTEREELERAMLLLRKIMAPPSDQRTTTAHRRARERCSHA